MWWQIWWVWAAAAFALGIAEMILPGFILLGFALGAAAMALMTVFSLISFSMSMSLVLFAALSLVAYIALRQFVPGSRGSAKIWERDINE